MSTSSKTLHYSTDLTLIERSLLSNPPYTLTIPPDSLTDPKRGQSSNKNLKPPRPSNPWILFRTNFTSMLRTQYPYSIQDISRMASKDWKSQPILVKQYFNALAKVALLRHKETYSGYIYRPRPKQSKKKNNWVFKEVDRNRFGIDKNNRTEKQRNNSSQIDKQFHGFDSYDQQSEYEQHQNPIEYFSSNYVEQIKQENFRLSECKPVDYDQPIEYRQLPISDDHAQLIESDQLNGYMHVEASALSSKFFQLNEDNHVVGYSQICEETPSNGYYELVSYDNIYSDSNNGFTNSDATNIDDMSSSGYSLYGNIDTSAVYFGEQFFKESNTDWLKTPLFYYTNEQLVDFLPIPNE
ncbi:6563_t:CDS:1 [Paraglomus occultum]|uniref:6563_t:CDS:1 n=1 Tax=Paraglomus occultum TaxID=144539 RepID=A0A9N9ADJ0_9GLOM|nr:6563_t:CDS:1 [Paraglomus occultum]